MKLLLQIFLGMSCIFQIWCNFDAQISKICKIHWKLRIKQKSVLFFKYLHNESSDLYEIWNLGSKGSKESMKIVLSWSLHTFTHTGQICAHVRRNVRAYVYDSCAHMCAGIFMKFLFVYSLLSYKTFIKIQAFVVEIFAKQYWHLFNPELEIVAAPGHAVPSRFGDQQ